MSVSLVLTGALLAAVSGVPGPFLRRHANAAQVVAALLSAAGCCLGLAGVGIFWATQPLSGAGGGELVLPWAIPGAQFHVGIDGLSALFLAPVFLLPLLGSIYGLAYWKQSDHPANALRVQLFYGLLPAGMALLVVARNGVLFLFGWEIMALSAFFLVAAEDQDAGVRAAGWLYLVATHVATLCLFALFALLARANNGDFTLNPIPAQRLTPGLTAAIFVLALVGFGLKAGVMPLHVWLPSAHAMAPSHVSAVMSGVLIKMGVYGIVRVTGLLPRPGVEWGALVLTLGAASGVLGVAYAIAQHDLKRLLAYHSIENIGIILMGIGLALLGRSLDQREWVVLGLAGGLLHVWNHALFKALLFLSAGSAIHATHTRDIDHLGGLARTMPWTATCFLAGAVAICGLPPLNGFVSEWLVYLGLFRTLGVSGGTSLSGAALAVPALALIGALALACFVKVFGAVFLGVGRSPHAEAAHESGPTMIAPMLVLVGLCLVIGVAPAAAAPALDLAVQAWAPDLAAGNPAPQVEALTPLHWISGMALLLILGLLLVGWLYRALVLRGGVTRGPTWGCGYVAPSPRIQYTSSSFAQMLVGLFAWALVPRREAPRRLPLFPGTSHFHSETPDAVLDRAVLPILRLGAWLCTRLRIFQQGRTQVYLLYIFLTLVALLLWP
jgi:hydrogenase-4 component B